MDRAALLNKLALAMQHIADIEERIARQRQLALDAASESDDEHVRLSAAAIARLEQARETHIMRRDRLLKELAHCRQAASINFPLRPSAAEEPMYGQH